MGACVSDKLAYQAAQDGILRPVQYLSAALRDDYSAPAEVEPRPEAVEAVARLRAAAQDASAQSAEREAKISAERGKIAKNMARVRAVVDARSPTQRDSDRKLFLSQLDDDLSRGDFAARGWASVLNARAIFEFWEDMSPGLFDGESFED